MLPAVDDDMVYEAKPPELVDRDEIEKTLVRQVMDGEVDVSAANRSDDNDEFEICMSLMDAERGDKEYDWMSDIRIPEFASHMLTQSSIDAGQYFQTRDFVEVYLEDEGEVSKKNSEAAKELINRTLNRRNLYHYMKFIRAKGINNIVGRVYAKCWWEQETIYDVVDVKEEYEELDIDVYGNPIVGPDQVPAMRKKQVPIYGEIPVIDQFNYDVWDQRNVFVDNSYVYSLQDKRFITFRSEMILSEIKAKARLNGYFNIDKLEKMQAPDITKFKSEAASKNQQDTSTTSATEKPFDIYERYGKFWTLVDTNEDGTLVYGSERIGLDHKGEKADNAQLHHVIITIAESDGKRELIGFKLTPFIDATGLPYIPAIRGLCYIHLTEDGGMGDGKYTKELQIAIDDTFNISQDRVMLATLPTIVASDRAMEDNSTFYFEPGHVMRSKGAPKDEVHEFKISDNIAGALQQIAVLTTKMQQVDSIQPPSMGQTGNASTTATAFSGAFKATGERANYKSLTFENTFLCDLYWTIQQMTYRFAKPETGLKLMGEKVYDFDPSKDYYYKPLSQSLEPEYSKVSKRKEWLVLIQQLTTLVTVRPDVLPILNYCIGEFVKLMGDEYQNVAKMLFNPQQANLPEAGGGPQQQQLGMGSTMPMSNQSGIPQGAMEQSARGMTQVGARPMIGM
jgi:hypothetical protein